MKPEDISKLALLAVAIAIASRFKSNGDVVVPSDLVMAIRKLYPEYRAPWRDYHLTKRVAKRMGIERSEADMAISALAGAKNCLAGDPMIALAKLSAANEATKGGQDA